jgi:hypothetical protein
VRGTEDGELSGVHACHDKKVPDGLRRDTAMVSREVSRGDGGKDMEWVRGM